MKKIFFLTVFICALFFSGLGCKVSNRENTMVTVAAAASLKNCLDGKLIPAFRAAHPEIEVQMTYDSSGKLQTQIEQGAPVDVFISAAAKQMDALNSQGLIMKDSIIQLLENKIVLIVPANSSADLNDFADLLKAKQIAIGDPASVPAGQYAREALQNMKLWEQVSARASLGANVIELLNWVAEGSADAGIVYATDAASTRRVKVVAAAPPDSVRKIVYPAAMVKATENKEAAGIFLEFLRSPAAQAAFAAYGFSMVK
jgi:molybdate transport system substrate-binding protein